MVAIGYLERQEMLLFANPNPLFYEKILTLQP